MKILNFNLLAFVLCFSVAILLFFTNGNFFLIFLNLILAILNLTIFISLTNNNHKL
jgi:hypothetical protein